jgi:signal peptidase I
LPERLDSDRDQTADPARGGPFSGIGVRLLVAAAIALTLVASSVVAALVMPQVLGVTVGHIQGTSMEPLLRPGDAVVVGSTRGRVFGVGDVVLFRQTGKLTLHRIVEQRKDQDGFVWLVTQGDNNRAPDAPIRASQVEGKLIGTIPLVGSFSRALESVAGEGGPWGIALTFAVLACGFMGLSALDIRSGPRNEKA